MSPTARESTQVMGPVVTGAGPAAPGVPHRPGHAAPAGHRGLAGWGSWPARITALGRRHWLLTVLLLAGLALRAVTVIAYHPALLYIDTPKYLYGEYPGADPHGYNVLLHAVLRAGDLGTVALLQHAAGLAMAVALYALLVRRGVSRWLAALAVAPLLLDAYQLDIEHMIMPDLWFEVLLAAGLVLLLWRPQPAVRYMAAAGLLLGLSATMKLLGEVLIVPALVYTLAAWGGWRRGLGMAAVVSVAFLAPILSYCAVSYASNGHFRLSAGQSVTGRMAVAADCATLQLPPAARALCPGPAAQRLGPDYLEKSRDSPLHSNPVPPGTDRTHLINIFKSAVEHQQRIRVAASIARDAVRLFALTRDDVPSVTPISRWQFQTAYPNYYPAVSVNARHQIVIGVQRRAYHRFRFFAVRPSDGGIAHVNRPAAAWLRSYQRSGGYTPGPLLAVCAIAGLAGSALALARRRADPRARQLALACLLFTTAAVVVLLAADITQFSWRYQLPGLITLPPAGALGISAVAAWWARRRAAASPVAASELRPPASRLAASRLRPAASRFAAAQPPLAAAQL